MSRSTCSELAGAGAEQVAGDADVVAEVEQLIKCESLFADRIEANVDLQPLTTLLQGRKARLALLANGHDSPGDGHRNAIGLQFFGGRFIPAARISAIVARTETGWDREAWPSFSISPSFCLRSSKRLRSKSDSNTCCLSSYWVCPIGKYTCSSYSGCMLGAGNMAYNRPIPDPAPQRKDSGGLATLVQAEKLMQIAILLPSAAFIGWLLGAWADKAWHQSWLGIAGIVFGGISGLVYVVRLVMATGGDKKNGSAGAK